MPSVVSPNVVMPSVITPNVVMPSVVRPCDVAPFAQLGQTLSVTVILFFFYSTGLNVDRTREASLKGKAQYG